MIGPAQLPIASRVSLSGIASGGAGHTSTKPWLSQVERAVAALEFARRACRSGVLGGRDDAVGEQPV
jgi:hypothetical protein